MSLEKSKAIVLRVIEQVFIVNRKGFPDFHVILGDH